MLREVNFSDVYIRIDQRDKARFRPSVMEVHLPGNVPVPDHADGCIENIRRVLLAQQDRDFSLEYDGMRMRVSIQYMADGSSWASLRRIAGKAPVLDQLNIDPILVPVLRGLGRRSGGLIITAGATGEGKTTTSTAMLFEYLNLYGHLAYTIEDPVEYNFMGPVGRGGYCYQIEVKNDTEWSDALKTALRWHPRYILVGEIRTPAAAKQLLRAATSGHLVMTTLHAGSVEEGLSSLIQMAESELGGMAGNLLADGLIGVIHQRLTKDGPLLETVFAEDRNLGDPIRACIRTNKIGNIRTYIHQQAAQLRNKFQASQQGGGQKRA